MKQKAKKAIRQPREGGIRPGDEQFIHKHTYRRKRRTNPLAPISLSGKKRNKELKRLRHQQKDAFEKRSFRKLREALEKSTADVQMKKARKAKKKKRLTGEEEQSTSKVDDVEME